MTTVTKRLSQKEIESYRRSLGPMPDFARLDSVNQAISVVAIQLQMTPESDEMYPGLLRQIRTLRSVRERVLRQ